MLSGKSNKEPVWKLPNVERCSAAHRLIFVAMKVVRRYKVQSTGIIAMKFFYHNIWGLVFYLNAESYI
jgi:hypothetical protein